MADEELIRKIAEALTAPGKANADRVRMITRAMEQSNAISPPTEDPFHEVRSRAIEITDLDGLPTFVTVGVVLERVESGWIPGLVALKEHEARGLDHVLRIWEHEARARLRALVEASDDRHRREEVLARQGQVMNTDTPWVTLGEMTKHQNAYRDRLKLPKHPHGECCTHYEEVAHAAMAALADEPDPNSKRK